LAIRVQGCDVVINTHIFSSLIFNKESIPYFL
jgi:hypothetical protein